MFQKIKQLWKSSTLALLSFLFASGAKASPYDDAQMRVQAVYGISLVTPEPSSPKEVLMRLLFPMISGICLIAAIIPARRFILRQKEKKTRIILSILLAFLVVLALPALLFWIVRSWYGA